FGVIATVGEEWAGAIFWWDESARVVGDIPSDDDDLSVAVKAAGALREWATTTGRAFGKTRGDKHKGVAKGTTVLASATDVDRLASPLAMDASAAVAALGTRREPHPLLPAFGQDSSANYFVSLEKAATRAHDDDIEIAWLGHGRTI